MSRLADSNRRAFGEQLLNRFEQSECHAGREAGRHHEGPPDLLKLLVGQHAGERTRVRGFAFQLPMSREPVGIITNDDDDPTVLADRYTEDCRTKDE